MKDKRLDEILKLLNGAFKMFEDGMDMWSNSRGNAIHRKVIT